MISNNMTFPICNQYSDSIYLFHVLDIPNLIQPTNFFNVESLFYILPLLKVNTHLIINNNMATLYLIPLNR